MNSIAKQARQQLPLAVIFLAILLTVSCSIGLEQNKLNTSGASTGKAVSTTEVLDQFDSWNTTVWGKSDGWSNGTMFYCGWLAANISFANSTMNLTTNNTPSSGMPYSAGEYRSVDYYSYGTYEARFKPAKASGNMSGSIFTYCGPTDGQPWDEIDIEFLGKDTTKVQFNYFVNGVGGHEFVADLGFDASLDYHTYTIEWASTYIKWYVDGKLLNTATGNSTTLPSHAGKIMLNAWPSIGVDNWLGTLNYTGPIVCSYDWARLRPGVFNPYSASSSPAATPTATPTVAPTIAPTATPTITPSPLPSAIPGAFYWFRDDADNNGVAAFSETWSGSGNTIDTGSTAGEAPTTSSERQTGTSSLRFHFNHAATIGYEGAAITSRSDGTGYEPRDTTEKNTGKDLRNYLTMTFWIKGDTNSNARIKFADINGLETAAIELSSLGSVSSVWQQKTITLSTINWLSANRGAISKIKFLADGNTYAIGNWTFYIDEIAFTGTATPTPTATPAATPTATPTIAPTSSPSALWWITEDANGDGAWNWGETWSGNGSSIATGNSYNDPPTSNVEKHSGSWSVKLQFINSNATGYAGAAFSTRISNTGLEAQSEVERNTGKNISSFKSLKFWIKGDSSSKARIKLQDAYGNETAPIELTTLGTIDSTWREKTITLSAITWNLVNRSALTKVKFVNDGTYTTGTWTFYIDDLRFE